MSPTKVALPASPLRFFDGAYICAAPPTLHWSFFFVEGRPFFFCPTSSDGLHLEPCVLFAVCVIRVAPNRGLVGGPHAHAPFTEITFVFPPAQDVLCFHRL